MRDLVLVLGDHLTFDSPALADFDAGQDRVLMIEARGEGEYVWSHKARIAIFLSAMRHFCNEIHRRRWPYTYVQIDDQAPPDFGARLAAQLDALEPQRVRVLEPGEWRMLKQIQDACAKARVPLDIVDDTHFMCSREDFAKWARDKRELRMEFFYREMRRRNKVLMDGDQPLNGRWNFDTENRRGYPKAGPGDIPLPMLFEPDAITRQIFELVGRHFADHPGSLEHFAWPVTREQALQALDAFVEQRLAHFGPHQDAMWTDTPWGWHAILSSSLNLHLLNPREVVAAAEQAYREQTLQQDVDAHTALASVEGFIRQIMGWREFMRGMYWLDMPAMGEANYFKYERRLPVWYWTAETQMNCMRECIGQTLKYGFAHHIQRLMVTGQFGVLAELLPQDVCAWYLAVYIDAIEWVELPNTAGMALFASGGRFTSKPYIASGQYINRMSNYCGGCRYKPAQRTGEDACPFTTLFWNFLDKHESWLLANPRTSMMARNVARLSAEERAEVRVRAKQMLDNLDLL